MIDVSPLPVKAKIMRIKPTKTVNNRIINLGVIREKIFKILFGIPFGDPGPFGAVDKLIQLEENVKRFHCIHHGYEPKLEVKGQLIVEMIGINLFLLIGICRLVLLTMTDDPTVNFLLGDMFHGNPYRFISYCLFDFVFGIAITAHLIATWMSLTNRFRSFINLHIIKVESFDGPNVKLRRKERLIMQKATAGIARLANTLICGMNLFIFSLLIYLIFTSLDNLNMDCSLIFQLFWLIIFCRCTYSAFASAFYACGSGLLSITFIVIKLYGALRLLTKYRFKRRLYNQHIEKFNHEVSRIIDDFEIQSYDAKVASFTLFIPFALLFDGLFFIGAIYKTDNPVMDTSLIVLGSYFLAHLSSICYFFSKPTSKSDKVAKYLYQISTRSTTNIRTKLQTLYIQERMLAAPCGLIVGDAFYLTTQFALIFLLENAANIMMFTVNFQK